LNNKEFPKNELLVGVVDSVIEVLGLAVLTIRLFYYGWKFDYFLGTAIFVLVLKKAGLSTSSSELL